MPVCTPCWGLGVRHIQMSLLFVMRVFSGMLAALSDVEQSKNLGWGISESNRYALNEFGIQLSQFSNNQIMWVHITRCACSSVFSFTGAVLAMKVNNKYTLLASALTQVAASVAIPFSTAAYGFVGFIPFLAVVDSCSALSDAVYINVISKWIPAGEVTLISVTVTIGDLVGVNFLRISMSRMGPSGFSSIHYLVGCLYGLWCMAYFVLGAQDPRTCFFVSDVEKDFLFRRLGYRRKINCKAKIPFRHILETPILYGLIAAQSALRIEWKVLEENQTGSGLPAANEIGSKIQVAAALAIISTVVSAILCDVIISRDWAQLNYVRKVVSSLGLWTSAVSCIFISHVVRSGPKGSWYVIAMIGCSIALCGLIPIYFDLSPNHACIIHGIVTPIPIIASTISYLLFSSVLDKETHNKSRVWDTSFFIAGITAFSGNLILIMAGEIGLKEYDSIEAVDWRKDSVISYP